MRYVIWNVTRNMKCECNGDMKCICNMWCAMYM